MYIAKMSLDYLETFKIRLQKEVENAKVGINNLQEKKKLEGGTWKANKFGLSHAEVIDRQIGYQTKMLSNTENSLKLVENRIEYLKSKKEADTEPDEPRRGKIEKKSEIVQEKPKREEEIDDMDKKIIDILINDSSVTMRSIGEVVKLSDVAIKKRIEKLKDRGVIKKFTIIVDRGKVGSLYNSVYTIGYANPKINISNFVDTLIGSKVSCLVDVRRNDFSYKSDFGGGKLDEELKRNNIEYVHLEDLGTPQIVREEYKNTKNIDLLKKRYLSYLSWIEDVQDNDFDKLISLCKEKVCCIMCSEEDPNMCHRSVIADELQKKLFRVEHLRVISG